MRVEKTAARKVHTKAAQSVVRMVLRREAWLVMLWVSLKAAKWDTKLVLHMVQMKAETMVE